MTSIWSDYISCINLQRDLHFEMQRIKHMILNPIVPTKMYHAMNHPSETKLVLLCVRYMHVLINANPILSIGDCFHCLQRIYESILDYLNYVAIVGNIVKFPRSNFDL